MSEPTTAPQQPESVALAPVAAPENAEVMRIKNERAMAEFSSPFASAAAYRHFMEIAKIFSNSAFVPEQFKGKPGECLIAMDIARRMGESELMVMQQMFVVKGRPGFSTKFMIGRANRLAGFKSTIKWRKEVVGEPIEVTVNRKVDGQRRDVKFKIPNMVVTAYAVDRFGELIETSVDTAMAIGEGWVENAKYESMPEHMFRWRSASMLINLYAPEVMMGMQTIEEMETMKDVTPSEPPSRVQALADRLLGPSAGGELVVDLSPTGRAAAAEDEAPSSPAEDATPAAAASSSPATSQAAPAPAEAPAKAASSPPSGEAPRISDEDLEKLRALLVQPPTVDEAAVAREMGAESLDKVRGAAGQTPGELYTAALKVIRRVKGK